MVQASSSVIVDGTWGTMLVPGLPFLITQNNSPSVRFLWNAQFVKLRGDGLSIIPPGPFPFPAVAIQTRAFSFIQRLPFGHILRCRRNGILECLHARHGARWHPRLEWLSLLRDHH